MANRCPNCGAPLPLGSALCFDCGAKIFTQSREPWTRREKTTIRRNTGERNYARAQARQTRHETAHTAHTTSREAGSPFEQAVHRPSGPHWEETMQRFHRPQAPKGKAARSGRASSPELLKLRPLVVVFVVFFLSMIWQSCSSSNADNQADSYTAYSYYESYSEEDGSETVLWYDSNDQVTSASHYNADGRLVEDEWYDENGDLEGVAEYQYNEDGTMSASIQRDGDGGLIQRTEYRYQDGPNGTWNSAMITTDEYGNVISEVFYDEDGTRVGYRYTDSDGEVWMVEGVDDTGTPLE